MISMEMNSQQAINEVDHFYPFSTLVKFTGLWLGCDKTTQKGKILFFLSMILAIILLLISLFSFATSIPIGYDALTFGWANRFLLFGMTGSTVMAALSIVNITANDACQTVNQQIANLKRLRRNPEQLKKRPMSITIRRIIFLCLLFSAWELKAFENILFNKMKSDQNVSSTENSVLTWTYMWGARPAVYTWTIFITIIAFFLYLIALSRFLAEYTCFNDELEEEARTKNLDLNSVQIFSKRHIQLISTMKYIYEKFEVLPVGASTFAIMSFMFPFFILGCQMPYLTAPYIVSFLLFLFLSVSYLKIFLESPGLIAMQIDRTLEILRTEEAIVMSTDPQIMMQYRLFVDRCERAPKLSIGRAIRITPYTFDKIVYIIPNLGYGFAIIQNACQMSFTGKWN